MIGGKIGGTFSVLLYENGVASTRVRVVNGGDVGLVVKSQTRFPAVGAVDFEIEPARKAVFTINFRVPEWAENFKATVKAGTAVADLLTVRFAVRLAGRYIPDEKERCWRSDEPGLREIG